VRSYAVILASALAVSCSGSKGDQSSTPSGPSGTPSQAWTLAGQVTDAITGQAVPGAALTVEGHNGVVTADADGRWRIEGTGQAAARLSTTVNATGFLPHETWVSWQAGGRQEVVLQVIPERPPFALSFYRYLVRNGFEDPSALQPIKRWTRNPNFYIETMNAKTGRPITSTELELTMSAIRQTVPQLTGGSLGVGAIEYGETARTPQLDFINVRFVYEPSADFCGRAYVGANPGQIEINYDRCAYTCGSMKVTPTAIAHEVGHALGFWHVDHGIMTPVVSRECADVKFTEAERVHAQLAYKRPVGNMDPDRDPANSSAAITGDAKMVACPIDRR